MEVNKLISNNGNLLEGPLLLKPNIFNDQRGYFYESWNQAIFDSKLKQKIIFSQDNHSFSQCGVLRGLHYQIPPVPQGKLVRCVSGEIFDVAVDIRKNSSTFLEWVSINLDNKNKFLLWIPAGFAHGFLALKDNSEVLYKASGPYSKDHERSLRWCEPKIDIKWPLECLNSCDPILSHKDANAPYLEEAEIFI